MSDDFTQVTKYLDITPSSRSEDTTLKQNQGIQKSRAIKKIRKYFTMPQITGVNIRGALLAQVDYTVAQSFYLTDYIANFNVTALEQLVILAIRWRVGTDVYRYRINYIKDSATQTLLNGSSGLQAAMYGNQLVPVNFVLEAWGLAPFGNFDIGPVDFITSRAVNPETPDELSRSFDAGTAYYRDTLGITFPEPIPTTYPEAAYWLTN